MKCSRHIACGAIVAVIRYAVFEWSGSAHDLLTGALVGDSREAWRRERSRTGARHLAANLERVGEIQARS